MSDVIEIKPVKILGADLIEWTYRSCTAGFGIGDDWATLCHIESTEPGKGHATHILTTAKKLYESQGKKFGGSIALNARMRRLYQHLEIEEYV